MRFAAHREGTSKGDRTACRNSGRIRLKFEKLQGELWRNLD